MKTKRTSSPAAEADAPTLMQKILAELRFFAGLAVFLLAMLTLVWGHFKIPSESMQPSLEVGDRLYVSKFAYGYSRHSLPLGLHNLPLPEGKMFGKLPKRGDVVVYRNPNNALVMIKRVIGLPGDELQMIGGRLYMNDEPVEKEFIEEFKYRVHGTFSQVVGSSAYQETLSDGTSQVIWELSDSGDLDETGVYIVPEGHVFMMGDNRDRSTDSRVGRTDRQGREFPREADMGPGFVPVENLIGRAELIMISFNKCDRDEGLRCPEGRRFMKRL